MYETQQPPHKRKLIIYILELRLNINEFKVKISKIIQLIIFY